jgi:hypothetical protein
MSIQPKIQQLGGRRLPSLPRFLNAGTEKEHERLVKKFFTILTRAKSTLSRRVAGRRARPLEAGAPAPILH